MIEPAPFTDENSQRHPEESHARFIKILESTTDLVLMTDREGRTLYINKAGRDILGWSSEDATDRIQLADIFPGWAYAIITDQAMPAAFTHGSWSGETALMSRTGREIPVLQVLLAHDGKDGEVDFFSTICRDISDRKQKELEQIEWSNRYDAAIRASGQALFDWDTITGQISYAGAMHRVTGYLDHELGGGLEQLRSFIHADDLSIFDTAFEEALANREGIRAEFRMIRKDRREITVKAEGRFFLDRQGRVGRMVGFLSDITAERIYERGVQLAHERLEHSVAERTKELERVNTELLESAKQQEAVARLGQRALMGLSLPELMEESVEIIRAGIQVDAVSINEWNGDIQMFSIRAKSGWPTGLNYSDTPGGTLSQSGYTLMVGHPVLSSNYETESRFTPSEACRITGIKSAITAPIQAGSKPFGILGAFSTRRRAYAQEDISFLQGIANILSAAIERLRVEDTARRAQAEAEAANRAKSEFLSRMSHELRTPLNAILGFTQLLEMEEHDARQAESIEHISRAGRNLLALINEVLDIARLDSGRVQFQMEPMDLGPFLSEMVALMRPLAERNQISIRIAELPGESPVTVTDRSRLQQVFQNLLSNAVIYNRPGGNVTIAVARSGTEYWKISVTDSGPGIPADCISRLFVPFERLGQKEGGTAGGTGLGLALCQRLVKALDGKIGVASTVGLGSTFWVEIPALVSIHQSTPVEVNQPETSEPVTQPIPMQKTILYVEDDLANYHLLERIISSRKDLRLVSAPEGRTALEKIREHQPNLVLLDLNLPDMPGEQLLEKLKADAQTSGIPVIIVTGEVMTDRANNLSKIGAANVLAKPYRIQELFQMLDMHLV